MFKRPFREYHLLKLLDIYSSQNLPLDLTLYHYFRQNKALGPKDRAFIADTAYSLIRWREFLDYLCEKPISWDKRFDCFMTKNLKELQENENIPLHVRLGFPELLFQYIVNSHGIEKAKEICYVSNQIAPTTIRVNTIKANRDEIIKKWNDKFKVSPCTFAPNGLMVNEKIHFRSLPEFLAGYFEAQDEGSQLLSGLVKALPGQLVMDYCSGSGGKTLAFAPEMLGKGQIFLHDIRKHALIEARGRLKRAGIQNAQIIEAESEKLDKLKKRMDWVLVDAPCSGTGTLRRNPDMKWNFTDSYLNSLIGQQRNIFEKALSFLKPNGKIVYATCSLLNEENQNQVAHFIKTYGLKLDSDSFISLPTPNGMDGFFGAVFKFN